MYRCARLSWYARRLLCWNAGLRWCSCGRWCIRWRRLLCRPLLRKRTQRDQTETESKQCFHIFGGVELTARHISFIPNRLDASRAKVSLFLSDAPQGERHLYFASGVVPGCRDKINPPKDGFAAANNQFALITRFRSGGQSPIRASNSSPARIGPTPDGVPVKITSPGIKLSDWLANETISPTE